MSRTAIALSAIVAPLFDPIVYSPAAYDMSGRCAAAAATAFNDWQAEKCGVKSQNSNLSRP